MANKQIENLEFKVPSRGEMGSMQEFSGSGGVYTGVVASHYQKGSFVLMDNI